MIESRPIATVAIPAYNEQDCIAKAIESVMDQTLPEVQILIHDNASNDETEDICRELARQDSRIDYHRHVDNIGLLPNFNSTFANVRGTYLRWLGADDWLAPSYLERCVSALDAEPSAVTASCEQAWVDLETGNETVLHYTGERITSADPVTRFRQFMRFMEIDAYYFDPIYSLHRCSAVDKSGLFPLTTCADQILAAEMAILGPCVHVPELLSYRHLEKIPDDDILYPLLTNREEKPDHLSSIVADEFLKAISRQDLSATQARACHAAVKRHLRARRAQEFRKRLRRLLGGVTGYRALKRRMMRT